MLTGVTRTKEGMSFRPRLLLSKDSVESCVPMFEKIIDQLEYYWKRTTPGFKVQRK